MAISDQLTLLNNTKTAIRTAINNKGGSVGASDTFASYATAIDNLPSGGSGNPLLTSIDVSDFTGTTFNQATRYITSVIIPNSVTTIGSSAFKDFSTLTSVTIPSSVTSIEQYAFDHCSALTSVNIPSGVTSIGRNAFYYCSSLTSVTIPSGVTSIGQYAFGSCRSLTSVTIPSGVTNIEQYTFSMCLELTSVNIPSGVTSIGQYAFKQCSSLTSVNIPSGVTSIGSNAFVSCSSLNSITVNATTPPTLASVNALAGTNDCPIYVPAASVDAYKAANNWSTYASRIYPITQLATVDGNPVYNYDIGNTDSTVITDTERSKIPTGDSIEFAEGVTQIGGQLGAYEEVILPSTFTDFIDTQPINAATTTLTSKATTPPSVERSNLGGSGLTAIYVPSSAVDTYKAHAAWGTFSSIIQAIPTE